MLKFFSLQGFHLFEQTKQCHSMAIQDICIVMCSTMIIFCYNTVVSCKYAAAPPPLFCMLTLGKTGEGAYARDHDISM